MKKNYTAPQAEIVRFDTEDVLNILIASGVGHDDVPEVGSIEFKENTGVDLF